MSTVEQISEALQAGRVKEVLALIDAGLEDGIDAQQMLEEGMLKGMA
ncbi:MAG: cobalamin-binding protein, partial [Brooklawnia sp.]|nr:cobalamin-binding protein [Brooklawnia sp.]